VDVGIKIPKTEPRVNGNQLLLKSLWENMK